MVPSADSDDESDPPTPFANLDADMPWAIHLPDMKMPEFLARLPNLPSLMQRTRSSEEPTGPKTAIFSEAQVRRCSSAPETSLFDDDKEKASTRDIQASRSLRAGQKDYAVATRANRGYVAPHFHVESPLGLGPSPEAVDGERFPQRGGQVRKSHAERLGAEAEPGPVSDLSREVGAEHTNAEGFVALCLAVTAQVFDLVVAVKKKLRSLAESTFLTNCVLTIIAINTLLMAIDHECQVCYDSCMWLKAVLEVCNVVFASIFAAEMTINVLGLGLLAYLRQPANIFDLTIVCVSLAEIRGNLCTYTCLTSATSCSERLDCVNGLGLCSSEGGLSVLRTFRLLRVVKFLRAFPGVQRQVHTLMSVVGSLAALILLILLFCFIACVLGMILFGGKLTTTDPEQFSLGASVMVMLPGSNGTLRHGILAAADHVDHAAAPWRVLIRFGSEDAERDALGLDSQGGVWATAPELEVPGAPRIVGWSPRNNFDDLAHAAVTTFAVSPSLGQISLCSAVPHPCNQLDASHASLTATGIDALRLEHDPRRCCVVSGRGRSTVYVYNYHDRNVVFAQSFHSDPYQGFRRAEGDRQKAAPSPA
jgi:hypothetical protein